MKAKTKKEYRLGIKETLDAMERISLQTKGISVTSLSAILTTAMHTALDWAPSEKAALRLIKESQDFALILYRDEIKKSNATTSA